VGELARTHAPAVDGDVPRGRGHVAVGVVGSQPGHIVEVDDGAGLARRQGASLVVDNSVPEGDGDGLALLQRLGCLFSGLRLSGLLRYVNSTSGQNESSKEGAHSVTLAPLPSRLVRAGVLSRGQVSREALRAVRAGVAVSL
jgi:hypothetical protein